MYVVIVFFFSKNIRVSLNLPTIEVRFENLSVEAEAYMGSRAQPSILNFYFNLIEVYCINSFLKNYNYNLGLTFFLLTTNHNKCNPFDIKNVANYLHILPSQKKKFTILRGVSGIVKPGRYVG